MAKNGTYYLGRVLKLGNLDQSGLMYALRHPESISSRGGAWALVDIEFDPDQKFVFGRLARYLPEGQVDVVDPQTLSTGTQREPNLLVASSPFIYIPAHSGIAFLANSGPIDHITFGRNFSRIVERSLGNFFVECKISLITDLRAFALRVSALDIIYRIHARVSPPNPLFGPLWEKLKEYLIKRNADKLIVTEDAGTGKPLNTILPELAHEITDTEIYPRYDERDPVPIGDAAILMAVDGYGVGTIKGRKDSEIVVIKTSETIANFSFEREPDSRHLFEAANEIFDRIKADRYMEHGQ